VSLASRSRSSAVCTSSTSSIITSSSFSARVSASLRRRPPPPRPPTAVSEWLYRYLAGAFQQSSTDADATAVLRRRIPDSHSPRPPARTMSSVGDWTILPDDLWLEQTARPLLGSTDPSSPQLPEALTKIATRHLEVRNGSKLHAYEVAHLAQYIRYRLPQLDPSAVSRAGAAEPTHTGTMQGLLDYWSCVVDRGDSTQASASDAYTPQPFHDTAALGQFLRENGALDMTDDDDDDATTSQTADSEVG